MNDILPELFNAWHRFRKGKSKKKDVLIFENHLETNIFLLFEEIISNKYEHGEYVYFQVFDSKKRSIHKASIKDRVVHELLRRRLERLFERKFIRDSFSSRKNKGVDKAIKKLQYFIKNSKYTISLDVKSYFNSINHKILLSQVEVFFHKNTLEYILSKNILKSFGQNGCGIPLGNSVSQIFSNIYLNDFDWFCLKNFTKYVRYNDDVRICIDKIDFYKVIKILNYFSKNLKLEIPEEKISIDINSSGILFLGYKIFPNYIKIKKESKAKILSRANLKNLKNYLGLLSNSSNHIFGLKLKSKCVIIDI